MTDERFAVIGENNDRRTVIARSGWPRTPGEAKHSAVESTVFNQSIAALITACHRYANLLNVEVPVVRGKRAGIVRQWPFAHRLAVRIDVHDLHELAVAIVVEHGELYVAPGRGHL